MNAVFKVRHEQISAGIHADVMMGVIARITLAGPGLSEGQPYIDRAVQLGFRINGESQKDGSRTVELFFRGPADQAPGRLWDESLLSEEPVQPDTTRVKALRQEILNPSSVPSVRDLQ